MWGKRHKQRSNSGQTTCARTYSCANICAKRFLRAFQAPHAFLCVCLCACVCVNVFMCTCVCVCEQVLGYVRAPLFVNESDELGEMTRACSQRTTALAHKTCSPNPIPPP